MKYFNLLVIFFHLLTIFCIHIEIVQGIIGGKVAATGQITYQISVQANKKHICGGCILNERYALSAANCFLENNVFKSPQYSVVAGVTNLKDLQQPGRVEVIVEKVFIPKEYKTVVGEAVTAEDANHFFNEIEKHLPTADVAVLKLEKDLGMKDSLVMSSLKLPPRYTAKCHSVVKYTNTQPIVSGFGIEDLKHANLNKEINNAHSFKLKSTKTNVLLKRVCTNVYKRFVDEKQVCAQVIQYDPTVPSGVCYGDIGAPLVHADENGTKFIIGILSSIPKDCRETFNAGVYTRISSYDKFIKKAMKDEPDEDTRIGIHIKKQDDDAADNNNMKFVEVFKFL